MESDAIFLEVLRQHWGYTSFRSIQLDIIRSIASGHDTLGLMPTGGGKSLTFQVPALAGEGMCLVVTPLIALMKDQVAHLRQRGIMAAAVYSGLTPEEVQRTLDNAVFGAYKLLYVSPERLSSELFRNKVQRMGVSFITVDEAHCISQWGYDFRPAYLEIAQLRTLLPDVPILALTATATPAVCDDICRQLQFREDAQRFRMSFERKNLSYVVRRSDDKQGELLHILQSVQGSAIVYVRSRQSTREVARLLEAEGISALYYHAGLSNLDKDTRQRMWQEGRSRVMVATNAFGMGIDKPDVRLVVHLDAPDSPEAYFQEAGRAGRDGQRAWAVLLWNKGDVKKLHRRVPDNFPDREYICRVYDALAYFLELPMGEGQDCTFELSLERFCQAFKFFPVPCVSALQLLSRAGYIDFREEEQSRSRLMFLIGRDELYRLHGLGREADGLINALLRTYGGMFSEYVYIDEQVVGEQCGLSRESVYQLLKALTHQRILHYVPRKSIPRVTYVTRRIESRHLIIGPEVYEDRRKQFVERLERMERYGEIDDVCRSRYFLEYFGDASAHDCGHCDVCIARARRRLRPEDVAPRLLALFEEGKPLSASQLRIQGIPTDVTAEALRLLVGEAKVVFRNGLYSLPS